MLVAAVLTLLAVPLFTTGSADAAVPREFFGVSAVNPTKSDYSSMAALGLGTTRVELSWRSIQKEVNGPFNWSAVDSRFRRAAENGLHPLPLVFGTPVFVKKSPKKIKPPVRSASDRRQWQRFVATAALRYGPGGAFWRQHPTLNGALAPQELIVWNEQNSKSFWHPEASPGEYANLVRITDEAVSAVDPSIKLVAGGMYGFPRSDKSLSMVKFVKKIYRQRGVKRALSGISLHPYANSVNGVTKQVKRARRELDRAGARRAGIWIGEIGWASGGPRNNFLVKNPRKQARLLKGATRTFVRKRNAWNIEASLWYVWRDFGSPTKCPWCPKAGLLRENSTPKPSFDAYRKLIARQVR